MKIIAAFLVLCTAALVIAAGCTSQQPAPQTTVPTTIAPVTTVPVETATTAAATAVPAELSRSWTLTLMKIKNGTVPMAPTGSPVTITFLPDGKLNGNGGCNGYSADFTLSGKTTEKGNGIAVRPITATKIFCNRVASQENTYFSILQQATAYEVSIDTLTITASDGTSLLFSSVKP